MQQVVGVQVRVGDGRSGEGGGIAGLLRQSQRRRGVLPAHLLDLVYLVEHQQSVRPDQRNQLVQHASRRLVVHQNQVPVPRVVPQRAPSFRRRGQPRRVEVEHPQLLPSAEGQGEFVHPRAEGVLGAHHHDALCQPQGFEAGVHAQHRGGLAGTGDGEVGGAPHGVHKEGVPHLPLPQRAGQGSVHRFLIRPELRQELFFPVFDLNPQPGALLQVVFPAGDVV